MPKGPKGEKRPADVVGAAVKAMKEKGERKSGRRDQRGVSDLIGSAPD